jgi:FkbM family methyltransferase
MQHLRNHPHFFAAVLALTLTALLSYSARSPPPPPSSLLPPALPTAGFFPAPAARLVGEAAALQRAAADARHLPAGAPPECAAWLASQALLPGFTSQYGQDSTIYYNFLAGRLAEGGAPGFFVDVGANAPRELSNTYFLEQCLGWKGLCIEADPSLAAVLRQERKCTVVNKCVDGARTEVTFVQAGSGGHIAQALRKEGAGTVTVACAPLASVLKEHGVARVDFLSIDIEGNEVSALSGYDWEAIPIEMLLAESAWSSEVLDMLLSDAGMWRVSDIGYLDDLYVRRTPLLKAPGAHAARLTNWDFLQGLERGSKKSFKRGW